MTDDIDPNLTSAIYLGYLRALYYLRLPHGETVQDICFREDYKLHDAILSALLSQEEGA